MRNISMNNVAVKPREIKMEIKVMSNKKRTCKPWKPAHNEILEMLLESGKHPSEIAPMMGRTENAVRTQMTKIGVYTKDEAKSYSKPKTVLREPKTVQIAKTKEPAPVNMAQLGLLLSQMDDMYDRSRVVVRDVSDMKSFLIDARDKAGAAIDDLKQTQQMAKASMVLNAITLGALAWIILS
jgi:hypothetical protein